MPIKPSLLAVALTFLAATGCVTTWKYDKPGVDKAQTRRDMDSCTAASKVPRMPRDIELSGGAVTGFPYEGADPLRVDACMTGRGYTRVDP